MHQIRDSRLRCSCRIPALCASHPQTLRVLTISRRTRSALGHWSAVIRAPCTMAHSDPRSSSASASASAFGSGAPPPARGVHWYMHMPICPSRTRLLVPLFSVPLLCSSSLASRSQSPKSRHPAVPARVRAQARARQYIVNTSKLDVDHSALRRVRLRVAAPAPAHASPSPCRSPCTVHMYQLYTHAHTRADAHIGHPALPPSLPRSQRRQQRAYARQPRPYPLPCPTNRLSSLLAPLSLEILDVEPSASSRARA